MLLNVIRHQTIRLPMNSGANLRFYAPVPHQRAIVLAAVQDQAFGGPEPGPVLTAACARRRFHGAAGNRSAGAELENEGGEESPRGVVAWRELVLFAISDRIGASTVFEQAD